MEELYRLCQSTTARRWDDLLEHLEWFAAHERLSLADQSRLIDDVRSRIAHWGAEERRAPETWLYDIETEDVWEYGANGVYSEEHFRGFSPQPHWLFPLAASVRLSDHRLNLCWDAHVAQLKSLDIWKYVCLLSIAVPMCEDCKHFVATDSRFRRIQIRGLDLSC